MAQAFNLTAQIQVQANQSNINQTVNRIKKQLQPIGNVNLKVNTNAQALAKASKSVQGLSKGFQQSQKNAAGLNKTLAESARRFSVITVATGTLLSFVNAFKKSVRAAIEFEAELIKISQVTGRTTGQLKGLTDEVSKLSTSLGVSSADLLNTSRILLQTGLSADKATKALEILAKTSLAATFDDIQSTTEGAIAILNQFGRQAAATGNDIKFLEQSLDAINAVSKNFAVESGDLVSAIRRVGGVFSNAGGSVEELVALFTSVRATTRESAETIATGLRTIFTRIQRAETVEQLKQLGIQLQDAQGNFVGAFEAVKRLSEGLSGLDPRSFRFSQIVEELGGFRQIGKVIPLINQFTVAQNALTVAQSASGSVSKDAQTAQKGLGIEIAKTREQFNELIRSFTSSETFRSTTVFLLKLAQSFIKVAEAVEPLLPLLGTLFALKVGQGLAGGLGLLRGFAGGSSGVRASKFNSGGMVPGSGNRDTVPAMLTPGEFVIRKKSVQKLGAENLAKMNAGGVVTPSRGFYGNLDPQGRSLVGKTKGLTLEQALKGGFNKAALSSAFGKDKVNAALEKKNQGSRKTTKVATLNPGTVGGLFLQTSGPTSSAFSKQIGPETKLPGKLSGVKEISGSIYTGTLDSRASASVQSTLKPALESAVTSAAEKTMKSLEIDPLNIDEKAAAKKAVNKIDIKSVEGFIFEAFTSAMSGLNLADAGATFDFPRISGAGRKRLANIFKPDPPTSEKVFDAKRTLSRESIQSGRSSIANKIVAAAANGQLGGGDFKVTRRNAGGGISSKDTVPALLTPGEFVFNKKAADRIGRANLDKMNKQGVQGFNKGGSVGFKRFAKGGPTGAGLGLNNVNVGNLNEVVKALNSIGVSAGKTAESTARYNQSLNLAAQALLGGASSAQAFDIAFKNLKQSSDQAKQSVEATAKAQAAARANPTAGNTVAGDTRLKSAQGLGGGSPTKSFGQAAAGEKKGTAVREALAAQQKKEIAAIAKEIRATDQNVKAKDALIRAETVVRNEYGVLGKELIKTTKNGKVVGKEQVALSKALKDRAAQLKSGAGKVASGAGQVVGGAGQTFQKAGAATQSLQTFAFAGAALSSLAASSSGLSKAQSEATQQVVATATTFLFLGSTILDLLGNLSAFGTSTKAAAAANAQAAASEGAETQANLVNAGSEAAETQANVANTASEVAETNANLASAGSGLAGALIGVAAVAAGVYLAFQFLITEANARADAEAKANKAILDNIRSGKGGSAEGLQAGVAKEITARNEANVITDQRNTTLGGVAAGAAIGAAIGSFVPVIGTAVGALAGAIIGGSVAFFGLTESVDQAAAQQKLYAESLNKTIGVLVAVNQTNAEFQQKIQDINNLPLDAADKVNALLSAQSSTNDSGLTAVQQNAQGVAESLATLQNQTLNTGKTVQELANLDEEGLKALGESGLDPSIVKQIELAGATLNDSFKGLAAQTKQTRDTLGQAAQLEITGEVPFQELIQGSGAFATALRQAEAAARAEAQAKANRLKAEATALQDEDPTGNADRINELNKQAADEINRVNQTLAQQRAAYAKQNAALAENRARLQEEAKARLDQINLLKQQNAQLAAINNLTRGFENAKAATDDFIANLNGQVSQIEIRDTDLGADLPIGQLESNLTQFLTTIQSLPPQFQAAGQEAAFALRDSRKFIEGATGTLVAQPEITQGKTADQIISEVLKVDDNFLKKQLGGSEAALQQFKKQLQEFAASGGVITPEEAKQLFAPVREANEGYANQIKSLTDASRAQANALRAQTAKEIAIRDKNRESIENYNSVVSKGAEALASARGQSTAGVRRRLEKQNRQRLLDAGAGARGGIKLEAGNVRQLKFVREQAKAAQEVILKQKALARQNGASAKTIAQLEKRQSQLTETIKDADGALQEFANSTAVIDELTEAIDKEKQVREQAFAVLKEFVSGGKDIRKTLQSGAAGILSALQTGTTQNQSEEQRADTFALLDKLKDVQIGTTGLTGGEIANEIVFRDAVRLGFPPDIAKQLATQTTTEEQMLAQLERQTKLQEDAFGKGGKPLGFAEGGSVPGSGNRDSVPAMLTPGEFVINKQAAGQLGSAALQHLNSGGMVQYFSGGGRALNKDKTQVLFEDGRLDLDTTRKLIKARNAFEKSAAGTRFISLGLLGNRAFDPVKWLESEGFKVDPELAKGRAATAVRDQYDKAAGAASKAADIGDAIPKFFQNFLDAYDFLGKKDQALNDKALAEIQKYRGARLNEGISDYLERGNQQRASAEYAALAEKNAAASRRFNARERLPKGALSDPNFVLDETGEEQAARNYSNAVLRGTNARIKGQIDNLLKTGSVNKPVAAIDLQKEDEKRYNDLINKYEEIAVSEIISGRTFPYSKQEFKPTSDAGFLGFESTGVLRGLNDRILKQLSGRFAFGEQLDKPDTRNKLAAAVSRRVGYQNDSDDLWWYSLYLQDFIQKAFATRLNRYAENEAAAQKLEDIEKADRQAAEDAEDAARLNKLKKPAPSYTWRAYSYVDPTDPSKGVNKVGRKFSTEGIYLGATKVAGKDNVTLQKTSGDKKEVNVPIELLDQDSKKLGSVLFKKYGRDARDDYDKSLLVYKAGGGSIFKPRGTDTVPAMLTPGEFVIKKSSVDKIGAGNLAALNSGNAAVVRSQGGPIYRAGGGPVNYLQQGGQGQQGINFQNAATQGGGVNAINQDQFNALFDNFFRSQINPRLALKVIRDDYGKEAGVALGQALKSGQFDPSRFLPQVRQGIGNVVKSLDESNAKVFSQLDATGTRVSQDATIGNIQGWRANFASALASYNQIPGRDTYEKLTAGSVLDGFLGNYNEIDQLLAAIENDFKVFPKATTIRELNAAFDANKRVNRKSKDFAQTASQKKASQGQGVGGRAIAKLRELGLYLADGGLVYKQSGGRISYFNTGGNNVADTIPAMLTPGEFVMSPEAVQKYGVGYMKSLNRGTVPGFRRGGLIGSGNVRYRANGSTGPESGGGSLSIDASGLQGVLTEFSANFQTQLDNMITAFSNVGSSINNLASALSQGMTITHNFSGDLSLAFSIQNQDQLKNAIADAIQPKIQEIITGELDRRLDQFNAGG